MSFIQDFYVIKLEEDFLTSLFCRFTLAPISLIKMCGFMSELYFSQSDRKQRVSLRRTRQQVWIATFLQRPLSTGARILLRVGKACGPLSHVHQTLLVFFISCPNSRQDKAALQLRLNMG